MKSLVLQGFVKMFAVRYPPFCCPLPPFFAVLQLSTFCPATVDFLSRHRPQDAKQGKIKCESGGFCPRSLSIRCNGTIYTLPRPGTLGRCLPLYFGQDFAREQRIGNPAALAACCRAFSGWWPVESLLRCVIHFSAHLPKCRGTAARDPPKRASKTALPCCRACSASCPLRPDTPTV